MSDELHPNVIENLRRHNEIMADSPLPGWFAGMVAATRIASAGGCARATFDWEHGYRLAFDRFAEERAVEKPSPLDRWLDDEMARESLASVRLTPEGHAPVVVVSLAECFRCGRTTTFEENIGEKCDQFADSPGVIGSGCPGTFVRRKP